MVELPESDLPSTVQAALHAALKVTGQVSAFVNSLKELTERHEELRERFERLEREQEALRQREAAATRESDESAEALAELRAAYDALLTEHESTRQALHKLSEERTALLEERRQMAEEIGALSGALRTSQGPVTLGATAEG
jgi:chromosome segregation ATPase